MELLTFALSGFWVFLGTVILITCVAGGAAQIILALRK